jgi:decaprenyl-phosphate phosphoribosyltransferase
MIARYLTMLRPTQWLKNLMIFFPPFLAGQMLVPGIVAKGFPVFCSFCLVSSAGYIFNDLRDRKNDLHHPRKCSRPIPSGTVGIRSASLFSSILLISGFLMASLISSQILPMLLAYAIVSFSYSLYFKKVPVVDLFCISAGFLIRLQTGGNLFGIQISSWLFVTVFLLAAFLSTGKRLSETRDLGSAAGDHRSSLSLYPDGFLTGTMYLTGCSVLVTYAMYALNKPKLIYSVPLCLFGLLRYILRVSSGEGGDPTESLLKDRVLFVVSVLWVGMVVWSIYV